MRSRRHPISTSSGREDPGSWPASRASVPRRSRHWSSASHGGVRIAQARRATTSVNAVAPTVISDMRMVMNTRPNSSPPGGRVISSIMLAPNTHAPAVKQARRTVPTA